MKITKIGHCCLVIEDGGVKLMTDPGSYSEGQKNVTGLDAIFITHEHQDHIHISSLKGVLEKNPDAKVVTNHGVAKLLDTENIRYTLVEDGQSIKIKGYLVEAHGNIHAEIHPEIPDVQNTGYFFGKRFFYPGDALHDPGKNIDILALPVAGPWLKISEAIEYARTIRPRVVFPVHDGNLKSKGASHSHPARLLEPHGIKFLVIGEDETEEF